MKRNLYIFTFLILLSFLYWSCAESVQKPDDHPEEDEIIDINTGISLGTFGLITGINCGPYSTNMIHDYSGILKSLGIRIIRTHDYYGPCDWYTIFPDWSADETNSENYNFQSSDQFIGNIIHNGFDVLYRLGPSWNDPVVEYSNDPPGTMRDNQGNITHIADHNDFLKFAVICRNIVRHYNEGWAGGYHFNIRRWEIWNEPSLTSQFWSGTHQQFYDMFGTVLSELKGYNPKLQVGGPGLAGHSTPEYEEGLLEYCMNAGISMDFFSWHNYGNQGGNQENAVQSPGVLAARATQVKSYMDNFGFSATSSICSEWNADLGDRNYTDSGKGAAFFGGALILMEEKGITESYLYRGDNHPLGIFRDSTVLKTGAYVLKKWKLLSEGNKKIFTASPENEELYVISSARKDDSAFYILLSNFSSNVLSPTLRVLDVNSNSKLNWYQTVWETSDYRQNEIISGPDPVSPTDSTFRIQITLQPESVKLISIQQGLAQ